MEKQHRSHARRGRSPLPILLSPSSRLAVTPKAPKEPKKEPKEPKRLQRRGSVVKKNAATFFLLFGLPLPEQSLQKNEKGYEGGQKGMFLIITVWKGNTCA